MAQATDHRAYSSIQGKIGKAEEPTELVKCTFGLQSTDSGVINFRSLDVGNFGNSTFSALLRSNLQDTDGLVFILITEWKPWFLSQLTSALPEFPAEMLIDFDTSEAMTMLPVLNNTSRELTCIMENIDIKRASGSLALGAADTVSIGKSTLQMFPLMVWTREEILFGMHEQHPRKLVLVVSGRGDEVVTGIKDHYPGPDLERWNRLESNQIWIYLDLTFLFTKWNRVFAAAKQNLTERIQDIHNPTSVVPILEQTRVMHTENNVMISLRELVRIQKESLKKLLGRMHHLEVFSHPANSELQMRLTDAHRLLEYYDLKATTLLEQQQNLIGLALNLETHHQGQAMGRLNVLAFIFLPLSFTASVFGITTFTAAAKWYPAFAFPLLLTTLVIASIANRLSTGGRQSQRTIESTPVPKPNKVADVEKSATPLNSSLKQPKHRNRFGLFRHRGKGRAIPQPIPEEEEEREEEYVQHGFLSSPTPPPRIHSRSTRFFVTR